jgi:hypothetical protein
MALDDRQPQAQHLPGEDLARQRRLDLAQPAALAQHQLADAPLLALRESPARRHGPAGRRCAGGGRGATPSGRSRAAHRPRPARACPPARRPAARRRTGPAPPARHPLRLGASTAKRRCSSATGDVAHVGRLGAAGLQALCRSTITPWRKAPLAACSALDAEVRGQRVQDGQATRQHGAALGLERRQIQSVDMGRLQAAVHAPAQPFGRDAGRRSCRRPAGSATPRRPCPTSPAPRATAAARRWQGLLELGAGGHLCRAEALRVMTPSPKKRIDRLTRAGAEGLRHQRSPALPRISSVDRPPMSITRRRPLGLQLRHAGVDQARFLAAGDHLDGVAKRLLGAQQEGVAVARLAQRLRGHGAHALRRKAGQPGGKAAQAGQAALRWPPRSAGRWRSRPAPRRTVSLR